MKPEALRLMRDRAQEAGLANATTWQVLTARGWAGGKAPPPGG